MKYVLVICLALGLTHCQSQETIKKKENMQENQIKNNRRTIYGIDLAVPGPFDLYINDIVARKENSPAMHNTLVEINPYVLKSGKYNFKLRVYPMPSEAAKGGIQPSTVQILQVALATYQKVAKGEGAESGTYKVTNIYPVPKIDKPVPYLDVSGEFEVTLPYELEGWSKGQDLSKMDSNALAQKVVAYYQKLWHILNNGDGESWKMLTEKRRQETSVFNYSDKGYLINVTEKDIEKIKKRAKNMMEPLGDYELKIYANGKLVSLNRKSHTTSFNKEDPLDIYNWSPLIRKYDISGGEDFPFLLYLPQDSDEFVIIRK